MDDMIVSGILVKMPVSVAPAPASASAASAPSPYDSCHTVQYVLRLEEPRAAVGEPPRDFTEVPLNTLVGRPVRIEHSGGYCCIRCGRDVDRLFGEGMCYPCFRDAPEAAECIVRPELCEAHLGRGRDPRWEEEHHNQPHAVYFARSSALKVGVTRLTQVPTRWVDQGAAWAVVIARLPYRQLAGRLEVALKDLYTDRTAWQRMLKDESPDTPVDLAAEMVRVREHLASRADHSDLLPFLVPRDELQPMELQYPVPAPPTRVKSVGLAKSGFVESVLTGIRGQYLQFDGGAVLNVRRHSGFRVTVTVGNV